MLSLKTQPNHRESRVVVLAPTGKDGLLICRALERAEIVCQQLMDVSALCAALGQEIGAAVVAEEALHGDSLRAVVEELSRQPSWSDFPLILVTLPGNVSRPTEQRRMERKPLGNVLLLERPIRPETLISTVQTALKSRMRQYQVRDQFEAIRKAETALRNSEKLATAGRLAATIAHEINNPLEALTNLLYLARTNITDVGQATSFITEAEEELKRVAHITKQTLGFHRGSSRPTVFSIAGVTKDVIDLFRNKLVHKKINVKCEFVAKDEVTGQPGEIMQVLANLLSNAIDASPYGSDVNLRVTTTGDLVQVSVRDHGRGISQEHMHRIFEPFFTTKQDIGTGLGLWVTKGIVEKHGGTVRVVSNTEGESTGAEFVVSIPRVSSPEVSAKDSQVLSGSTRKTG